MTISIQSTSDSPEAVTAAMGDLASTKPVEDKAPEETPAPTETDAGETAEPEEDVAEPSEPEEDTETEELETSTEDETKPKKKGGFQKRIDKLNKKLSAIDQEKEYWRGEALRTKNPDPKPIDEKKPDLSKKPKADDFASHEEFVEALTDWKLEAKLLVRDQKQKEDAVKSEVETKIGKHRARVDEFAKGKDDWDEVTDVFNKAQISLTVQEAIVNSEHGPDMLYELGKDQKELNRICGLPPIQAAMALGKIEARFSKPSESSEKKITKAPAPVSPVRTRGATNTRSIYDAENLSQRDWEKLRNEELKQKNLRR